MRLQKSNKGAVEFFGMREVAAMWAIFDDMQLTVFNGFVRSGTADFDRDNLVIVAMNNECWDIELLQVGTKVCP